MFSSRECSVGEIKNEYRSLLGKGERKITLEKRKWRREDNIKIDFTCVLMIRTGFKLLGFEVLGAVVTKVTIFWVAAPCICCIRHRGQTTQKTAIFCIHLAQTTSSVRWILVKTNKNLR